MTQEMQYRCLVGDCEFTADSFTVFSEHTHTHAQITQDVPDFLRGQSDENAAFEERAREFRERIQFGVRLTPEELQDLAASMMTQANAEAEARARKRGNGPDVELRTGPEMLAALKLALEINAVSKAEAKPMLRKLLGKKGREPKRGKQPAQLRRKP